MNMRGMALRRAWLSEARARKYCDESSWLDAAEAWQIVANFAPRYQQKVEDAKEHAAECKELAQMKGQSNED